MLSDAIQELSAIQQQLLNTLMPLNDEDCRRQFHDDLSPIGWHLMHTVFTENLWLRERILSNPKPNEGWHRYFIPNNIAKSARGKCLPKHDKLITQAARLQADNRETLRQAPLELTEHPLMKENYLVYFLAQHHAMHLETIRLALSQKQIKLGGEHHVESPLKACAPKRRWLSWEAGEYPIGDKHVLCFDNERRQHERHLEAFAIGRQAVSNAEYLGFIESQGYRNKTWWSQSGWQWRQQKRARAPDPWRQDKQGRWHGHDLRGACDLQAEASVYGVNWHEACAYARYAGGRLPNEYEWETAHHHTDIVRGQAWEWCANTLSPYPDFRAYPYKGYSSPWFDGHHYVLRGASRHSPNILRRITFRNFHHAWKRHIHAGIRLAQDGR